MKLRVTGGAIVDTATTDDNGFFGFAPALGFYTVEVVLPAAFAFAPLDQGSDDSLDSDIDPTTGFTPFFSSFPSTHDLTWDAGLVSLPIFADGFESGNTSAWSASLP